LIKAHVAVLKASGAAGLKVAAIDSARRTILVGHSKGDRDRDAAPSSLRLAILRADWGMAAADELPRSWMGRPTSDLFDWRFRAAAGAEGDAEFREGKKW
jgi:hypothetical protein